jgi:hypothetical protein
MRSGEEFPVKTMTCHPLRFEVGPPVAIPVHAGSSAVKLETFPLHVDLGVREGQVEPVHLGAAAHPVLTLERREFEADPFGVHTLLEVAVVRAIARQPVSQDLVERRQRCPSRPRRDGTVDQSPEHLEPHELPAQGIIDTLAELLPRQRSRAVEDGPLHGRDGYAPRDGALARGKLPRIALDAWQANSPDCPDVNTGGVSIAVP